MTRNLKASLLIASMLVVLWTTSSQACHRRRACRPDPCCQQGYTYASPTGYYTADGSYYGGGYAGGTVGYPGGYGYGRTYNPGGIGGPFSGLGVRPGLGFGGLGLGR